MGCGGLKRRLVKRASYRYRVFAVHRLVCFTRDNSLEGGRTIPRSRVSRRFIATLYRIGATNHSRGEVAEREGVSFAGGGGEYVFSGFFATRLRPRVLRTICSASLSPAGVVNSSLSRNRVKVLSHGFVNIFMKSVLPHKWTRIHGLVTIKEIPPSVECTSLYWRSYCLLFALISFLSDLLSGCLSFSRPGGQRETRNVRRSDTEKAPFGR